MLVRNPPFPEPVRRLFYDGFALAPVAEKKDTWLLPGGLGTASTGDLFKRAKRQRVHCCLFVRSEIGEKRDE
jgi:hypothetical protein